LKENYDFFSLPLFVRENSIIAMGNNDQTPEYDYTDGLTLNIFSLKDKAETVVCDMYGNEALKVNASNDNGKINITLCGEYKNLRICMRNVSDVKNISGADVESGDMGVILNVNANEISFEI